METILQFGAGNFLRAFFDAFVAQANRGANPPGKIIVVQSTGVERARLLNECGGRYHVVVQGFQEGQIVNDTEVVDAISRALVAETEWDEVVAAAVNPALKWIVSNVTEAGFGLDPKDEKRENVPRSFPAKLLTVLLKRLEAGLPGPVILPLELIEHNATKLRALVLDQAVTWNVADEAMVWLKNECSWVETLVDRIVPGPPREHPLLGQDPLLLSTEPFAMLALQLEKSLFPENPLVVAVPDIEPYYLRKVRILNGAHTALVAHAMPRGFKAVRECVEDPEVGAWLQRLLFDEIVPTLEGRVADPARFAKATLDRFRNPFLDHQLSSIAVNHETKRQIRLATTLKEYREKFGREPELLASLFAQ